MFADTISFFINLFQNPILILKMLPLPLKTARLQVQKSGFPLV